jgi:hypothetical protein
VEPISTISTTIGLAKTAGDLSKKLFDFGKSLKDREQKHQLDQIMDQLRDLKQSASELEDQNRELREKLRFKSDDYEFRSPFWYEKTHPNQALCPTCFAKQIPAPMAPATPGQDYRMCLVCRTCVDLPGVSRGSSFVIQNPGDPGEW